MPLNELQKTFQCGESLASEDLNSIVQAINNTVTAVNTIKNNLEGHQYDVSVPITSIYCRTKKNINASGFFPQSDAQKVALFEEVTNCQLTQGIKYNVNFLTVTLDNIADNMNGVWTAYPQGITEELPHEWEASFKKLEDSNEVIFMFGPVLVSNYGFSGADGDGVQYVYKLFDHELTEIERTANTPVKPASPNQNGEYIPSGWFDDPQGTTSEYPYEYVATLKRTNGSWGDFEKIALWGTYSEDGINGDFQTRVFCRFNPTALKLAPNKPLGGTYDSPQPGSNDSIAWSMTVPSGDGLVWTSTRTFKGDGTVTDWSTPVIESDSNELDIEYSSSATKPSVDTLRGTPGVPHPSNNVWHDPSESGIDLSSMVWRAERKIKNKVYEGNWVITRLTGVKGSFKSMVFKRFTPTIQQSSPATPSGGTYDNPVPSGWSDGIPGGNGPIWASTCTFTEEDTEPVSSLRWSEPKLQSDTEELDIEFSPNTTQPSNPTGEPFSNRQSQGWYDSSASNFNSVGPMIWRAERKVVNGQYEGSWTVTRIFGEQGVPGVRGDFVSRVFCRKNTKPSRPTGGSYESPYPEDNVGGVLIWSDGIPSGEGIIWSSTRLFYGDSYGDSSNPATVWSDPAQESDTTTLDIEYSNNATEPSSETLRQNVGDPHPANSGVNWYDPVTSTLPEGLSWNDMIWRAERQIKNGEYSGAWVISRIKGEEGAAGSRGPFKSFVFKRENTTIENITISSSADASATYNNPIPTGWYDSVPEGTAILWMASSTFTGNGNEHSAWNISQQSDTVDLDIEFSKSTNKPNAPSGAPFSNRSSQGWYDSNTVPAENDSNNPGPIIWRAERKVYNNSFKESDPWIITKIYGEKGETGFKGNFISRVFCRSNSTPANPTGGSYNDPIPTNEVDNVRIWSDGIPSGQAKLWSSVRTFYGDETVTSAWSTPSQESDTLTLDIEYSPSATKPTSSTLRSTPTGSHPSSGVWYDPSQLDSIPSGQEIIWRAERVIDNGVYAGEWVITRIKGEQGIQGVRGGFKSFVFKRSNDVISSIAVADDNATYDNPIPNNTWSDSVPEGTATLWMAVSKFTGVGDTHTSWTVSQQSDSRDFDIEFSTQSTKPSAPQGDPFRDRRSDNPVWYNSNTIPSGETAIWRAERKVYEGKFRQDDPWVITRIQGERGSDAVLTSEQVQILAKAGLEIIINPQNIILDQSEVLTSASDDKIDNDFTVNISVYKNGTILNTNDYQINSNSIQMYGNGSNDPFVNTSNAFFEVQSKAIVIKNLPITTNNNQYTYTYNKGHIKGTIAVILEGTTYNVPFNIPWYLNKLGERIEKLKGDISETYLSRDVFTNDHANKTIKQEFDAYINQSAQGTIEQYSKNVGLVDNNGEINVPTLQAFGEFQRDATSNISKLSKSITGTNLLSDNWTTFSSPIEITTGSGVTMERRVTKVSPQIPLSEGIYILSWYSTETSPNNFKVSIGTSASKISGNIPYITNNDITWQYYGIGNSSGNLSGGRLSSNQETEYEGDYYTRTENSSEVTYVRFYCRIIVNTEQYYSFVISTSTGVNSTYPIIRPQLELCLATNTEQFPTSWVPGPQDFSSEIKQTAESIQSQVTGLKEKKNLFSGALTGTDWKGALYVVQEERYRFIDITAEDYWFIKESLASYVASPVIAIESGKKYTLSFDAEGTSAINVYILVSNVQMLTLTTSATSRRTVTFTASSTGNVRFMFDVEKIRYPQLEKGEEATIFEAGDEEISSIIKQTADSISLNVTSAQNTADNINSNLVETGINITGSNRGIEMTADNFTLKDTNNNLVFGKDPNTNNMTFTGEVKASSFVAGDSNNLTIETSGNTIKFNDNGVTKAYFIAEGSGLQLYIKDDTGIWKKIDFTKWASGVAGDTTDTDIVFYTLRNGGNSNGAEINSSIEVPYNTSLNKYYEDRAGTTKKTLGNSTQYYKKQKISNVVIYENGSYYIYNGSTEDRSVYKYTPITITDGVLSESGTPYFVANGNYLTREGWITAATTNIFYKDSSVSIKDNGGNMNYTDSSFSLDKVSKTTTMTSISAYSTITSQSVGGNNAGFRYVVSTVPVSS